jgi:hypothetical protein
MAVGAAETPAFRVADESAAWDILKRALGGEFDDLEAPPQIEFDKWVSLRIRLGIGESTITPTEMHGLLAVQEALYRTYAILKYDTRLLTSLSDEEKQYLEIVVKVSPGSSIFDIDLQELLRRALEKAGDKMEARHWIIMFVTVSLLITGNVTYSDYLNHMAQIRKEEVISEDKKAMLEAQTFVSAQETERMKILAEALSENPQLSRVEEEVNHAKKELLKSLPEEGNSEINGIVISGEIAHEIIKTARQPSEDIEFAGVYKILRVDASVSRGFRVKLESVETGDTFTTGVEDILKSEQQVQLLKDAEWAKRPVLVTVAGKVRRGRIVQAVITAVKEAPKSEAEGD